MISMSLYIYLSHELCHEVTIDGNFYIYGRADEQLDMSVESLVDCDRKETWQVPQIQYICPRETLKN